MRSWIQEFFTQSSKGALHKPQTLLFQGTGLKSHKAQGAETLPSASGLCVRYYSQHYRVPCHFKSIGSSSFVHVLWIITAQQYDAGLRIQSLVHPTISSCWYRKCWCKTDVGRLTNRTCNSEQCRCKRESQYLLWEHAEPKFYLHETILFACTQKHQLFQ